MEGAAVSVQWLTLRAAGRGMGVWAGKGIWVGLSGTYYRLPKHLKVLRKSHLSLFDIFCSLIKYYNYVVCGVGHWGQFVFGTRTVWVKVTGYICRSNGLLAAK